MNQELFQLNSISDIVKFGVNQKGYWFRGHSKVYNELTPSVFRGDYYEYASLKNFFPENFFCEKFMRFAPSIIQKLPSDDSYLEWLCLMQHHRLPTRLLDWTQNILVAVFFAVMDDKSSDGEVFVLDPHELNKAYDLEFPSYENNILKHIAIKAFKNEDNPININVNPKPKTPLAFLPNLFHPRLAAQKSAFTIHPSSEKKYGIISSIKDEKYLFKFVIPFEVKNEICLELHNLGINYVSLFPDLDGLSKFLKLNFKFFGGGGVYKPNMEEFSA
jgi:hypothetical protein